MFWFNRGLDVEQFVVFYGAIVGMINQFQFHGLATAWTAQGIVAETFKEQLGKGFAGYDAIASRVRGCREVRRGSGWNNACQLLSNLFIAHVAVQAVVADTSKALGQEVLDHAADEA